MKGDVAAPIDPVDGDAQFDPNVDLFLGESVAIPLDGTNQFPNGFWKFEITVDLRGLVTPMDEDDTFTLEIKPEKGSVLIIERTIPPLVDDVMNLN